MSRHVKIGHVMHDDTSHVNRQTCQVMSRLDMSGHVTIGHVRSCHDWTCQVMSWSASFCDVHGLELRGHVEINLLYFSYYQFFYFFIFTIIIIITVIVRQKKFPFHLSGFLHSSMVVFFILPWWFSSFFHGDFLHSSLVLFFILPWLRWSFQPIPDSRSSYLLLKT